MPEAMGDQGHVETLTAASLHLSAVEQELVGPEVRAVAALQPSPAARQRYLELADLVESGQVPADRLEQLALVLEVGLQSGRIRRRYGPDGEMALSRIYQRTPRGAEAQAAAAAVTEALRALHGQVIEDLRVTVLGPGAYSILIDTHRCQVTVRLDRSGIRIDNVAVGI